MPRLAPYLCTCGRPVPAGHRCPCKAKADKARSIANDNRRGSSAARGYGGKWRKESQAWLASHPICEDCGEPSQCVDHAIPHRGDDRLMWSRSNWIARCNSCHSRKTASQDGGFGNPRKTGGQGRTFSESAGDHAPPVAAKKFQLGASK